MKVACPVHSAVDAEAPENMLQPGQHVYDLQQNCAGITPYPSLAEMYNIHTDNSSDGMNGTEWSKLLLQLLLQQSHPVLFSAV